MSNSTEAPAEAGTISLDQAAALLMVSPKRIRQLADEGYCPRPIRGRVPLAQTVEGYFRFLRDDERRSAKSAAASRVLDARAEEIAGRNERRAQRLIDDAVEAALAVLDESMGGLKSDLLSVPARVTNDLALRRQLEAEFNSALKTASDRLRVSADAARSGAGK